MGKYDYSKVVEVNNNLKKPKSRKHVTSADNLPLLKMFFNNRMLAAEHAGQPFSYNYILPKKRYKK